jgi:hypothetical protein
VKDFTRKTIFSKFERKLKMDYLNSGNVLMYLMNVVE